MGLDTVELMVEIENFFDISIPNKEAEIINTLQDATNCVCHHLGIAASTTLLKEQIAFKIKTACKDLSLRSDALTFNDPIFEIINPGHTGIWKQFSEIIQLIIPIPEMRKSDPAIKKWLTGDSFYDYNKITFGHFIDTICVANYLMLVDKYNFRDQYDIYIGVAGITMRISGVDPYEIAPSKSFTTDLGMD